MWFISYSNFRTDLKMFAVVESIFHSSFITETCNFGWEQKVKPCNSFFSIYQSFSPHKWKTNKCCFSCRSRRLVPPQLRQLSVVGGRPGWANQDRCCCYAGSLRQLWLAYILPADVQRYGTQLETVQTGGQYRGEWHPNLLIIHHSHQQHAWTLLQEVPSAKLHT